MNATSGHQISGATRIFGFLGDPVAYAKSPQNMNPLIAQAGHDAVLVPFHVPRDRFETAIGGILAIANLDGLVVTMPYKEPLIRHIDEISPRARAVGAINAARRDAEGRWFGDIFDGVGLMSAVEGLGIEPRGLNVGLVGAGGAGAAIAFALADAGVGRLAIHDNDSERTKQLGERVSRFSSLVPSAGPFDVAALDLLVHATPVGMDPADDIAIDISRLSSRTAVVDIVTRPDTRLLQAAARLGCRHVGGAEMVKGQTRAILGFFGLV